MPTEKNHGWILIYDVKGQCGSCKHVCTERNMASCEYGRHEFGNAHNCPVYSREGE